MQNLRKHRTDIQFLRIISMMMIVLCHIIHFYEFIPASQILGQVFNVGVYVFLLISGFLYGKTKIDDFGKWLKKRFVRILVPTVIVTIVDLLVLVIFFDYKLEFWSTFGSIFNLQGLSMINGKLFGKLGTVKNLGPLWFTTIILLCYLTVPFLQKVSEISLKSRWTMLSALFVAVILLSYFVYFNFIYFIVFFAGYFIAKDDFDEKLSGKLPLLVISIIALALQVLRLYIRVIMDESQLYHGVVSVSHFALGLMIFVVVAAFYKSFPNFLDKMCGLKFFKKLDKLSFHIFLVHGAFCMGETNLYQLIPNLWLATLMFFLAVTLCAVILEFLDRKISKVLLK